MFGMHRKREGVLVESVFLSQARRAGVLANCGDVNRRRSREETAKNVQIASRCIRNWYESSAGVSRRQYEVLMPQRIATMPLPVEWRYGDIQSCIRTDYLGASAIQKRPPIRSPWATGCSARVSLPCSARVSRPRRNRRPQVSSIGYRRPLVRRGSGVGAPRPTRREGMELVNQKSRCESNLRRHESTKQVYA